MQYVVLNEQHTLLPQQEEVLRKAGWTGATIKAPATGWSVDELFYEIQCVKRRDTLIFASPIMGLAVLASRREDVRIRCLHNDKREAVETTAPDGTKVVRHVIAKDGWQLI